MEESPGFRRAVTAGTRTRTGVPGAKYWQQWSKYTLAATYDPGTGRLTGTGTIRYYNRSPRQLTTVYVHLHDNLFSDSAVRNETVPITGGVTLSRVAARGTEILPASGKTRGYRVNSTVMSVPLSPALAAGDSVDLEFALEPHRAARRRAPRRPHRGPRLRQLLVPADGGVRRRRRAGRPTRTWATPSSTWGTAVTTWR